MELTSYELALIAGGIGIAGTLIGVLCTYWLSIRLADRQFKHLREISKLDAWHVAAGKFSAAFSEELAVLESGDELSVELDTYLFNAYEAKHKVATAAFEHFLSEVDRKRFSAACHQYHSGQKVDGEPLDMFEMGATYKQALFVEYQSGISWHHPVSRRVLAVNRIRELLAFARHE